MDFALSSEQLKMKRDIADFAFHELPADLQEGSPDFEQQFHGRFWDVARQIMPKVAERGWLAPMWPAIYGGGGKSPTEQAICCEEMAYWEYPAWTWESVASLGSVQVFLRMVRLDRNRNT